MKDARKRPVAARPAHRSLGDVSRNSSFCSWYSLHRRLRLQDGKKGRVPVTCKTPRKAKRGETRSNDHTRTRARRRQAPGPPHDTEAARRMGEGKRATGSPGSPTSRTACARPTHNTHGLHTVVSPSPARRQCICPPVPPLPPAHRQVPQERVTGVGRCAPPPEAAKPIAEVPTQSD